MQHMHLQHAHAHAHAWNARRLCTSTMSSRLLLRALLLCAVAVASAQGEEPEAGSVPAEVSGEREAPAASDEVPQASTITPALVASILLPLLIAAFFLLRGGGAGGGKKAVLFGPMSAGKTSMYLHLRFGRSIPSHTSMQLTSATFAPKCEGASASDKPITVVDVPGEPRLNYQLLARSTRLKGASARDSPRPPATQGPGPRPQSARLAYAPPRAQRSTPFVAGEPGSRAHRCGRPWLRRALNAPRARPTGHSGFQAQIQPPPSPHPPTPTPTPTLTNLRRSSRMRRCSCACSMRRRCRPTPRRQRRCSA